MKQSGRTTLTPGIVEQLSLDIAEGHIEPGQKLSEAMLAKRFGTSRGPIREGLRRLEERGLVSFHPNIGARVATYSVKDYIHLFQAREAMEGMTAKLAAESMSLDDKTILRTVFHEHEKQLMNQPDSPYDQDPGDWDFHYLIAKRCGNPILSSLLCDELYQRIRLCRKQHCNTPGRGVRALKEHRRILEAIEENDGELAELMMRRHIAAARKVLESFLLANPTTIK
ncbi:DNA-binding transcriptional regulator, GntR family [Desulfuromusa kysingii]|uniref:DNA-binding transcriptional regulator, GntR family n=1 Tax=Desulfuromusa kysingii TaxID=37625 RepID=A0A1H4E536_9BACT|nr:GntR family transcriptional regulator [Desulfuromusa kysingii]SEA80174.1 DNA-binding transcriptional regulator, GntR family [Desulfuromusa kysingii]